MVHNVSDQDPPSSQSLGLTVAQYQKQLLSSHSISSNVPQPKSQVPIGMVFSTYHLHDDFKVNSWIDDSRQSIKQIFISRDVIFVENVFPFHSLPQPFLLVDPFPKVVLPKLVPDYA